MTEEAWIRNELLGKYRSTIRAKDRVGEWSSFQGFYRWALDEGYQAGYILNRRDSREGHSPENCFFTMPTCYMPFQGEEAEAFIRRWTETVNRIRKAWGMELLPEDWKK